MKTKLLLARRVLRGAMSPGSLVRNCCAWFLVLARNHAGATASRNHGCGSQARHAIGAQQCVHLTGGSLRVFERFAWLEVDSVKEGLSYPAHQQVTRAVGPQGFSDFEVWAK